MDVSLVSSKGIPEDAIISIRSGAVRRQGQVSSKKPFHFPQNATESDCVVKVDIMQNIGSGYIVVKPNSSECKQYQVVIGNKPDMVCEVSVEPTSDGAASAPDGLDEAAVANKTKDAKEYMASTGLLQFVQGALQVVVKQQPEDPYGEMAKHFLSGSTTTPKAETPALAASKEEAVAAAVPTEAAADKTDAIVAPSAPDSPAANEGAAPAPADEAAVEGEEKAAPAQEDVIDESKSETEEITSALHKTVADAAEDKKEEAAVPAADANTATAAEDKKEEAAAPVTEASPVADADEKKDDGPAAANEASPAAAADDKEAEAAAPGIDAAQAVAADDKKEGAAAPATEAAPAAAADDKKDDDVAAPVTEAVSETAAPETEAATAAAADDKKEEASVADADAAKTDEAPAAA